MCLEIEVVKKLYPSRSGAFAPARRVIHAQFRGWILAVLVYPTTALGFRAFFSVTKSSQAAQLGICSTRPLRHNKPFKCLGFYGSQESPLKVCPAARVPRGPLLLYQSAEANCAQQNCSRGLSDILPHGAHHRQLWLPQISCA